MKLALIDNNDSFTFNIVEMLRKFPACELSVLSSISLNIQQIKNFDKIILSPGPGLPYEFPILRDIIKTYYKNKPILGICLGHEAIGQFFGARLKHLPLVIHGQPRGIIIQRKSPLFANLPAKFNAGLYHSWVLNGKDFPNELEITGISNEDNIMAIRHKNYSLFGIQFHPESIITEYGKEIIKNFLNV